MIDPLPALVCKLKMSNAHTYSTTLFTERISNRLQHTQFIHLYIIKKKLSYFLLSQRLGRNTFNIPDDVKKWISSAICLEKVFCMHTSMHIFFFFLVYQAIKLIAFAWIQCEIISRNFILKNSRCYRKLYWLILVFFPRNLPRSSVAISN